jgi:hypothetical protein
MKVNICIEETRTAGAKRYHFVVIAPFVGKLSGTPGRSRSIHTWASKRSALKAGLRDYPGAVPTKMARAAGVEAGA